MRVRKVGWLLPLLGLGVAGGTRGAVATSVQEAPAAATPATQASPAAAVVPAHDASGLVELTTLDPTIRLDIRYASANNFLGRPVYREARAFLQRPAAEAVLRAHRALARDGFGLLVFDGYRPWSVTKLFWDLTPPAKRAFVADPSKGSKHNRGCAIDLTLYELASDREVAMPSPYDDFSARAAPDYAGGTPEQSAARDRLRATMEREGFAVEPNEWWHFNYRGWERYPILDVAFEEIAAPTR
jgi:D-alanyl-D-alanine dipeptidase